MHDCLISDWVNPKSVSSQDNRESSDCSLSESFTSPSCTLGVDLRRGRRRFSGNLQLPPLSWRQGERSRTPDDEVIARPTSLPFGAPPRIDITPVDPEWWVANKAICEIIFTAVSSSHSFCEESFCFVGIWFQLGVFYVTLPCLPSVYVVFFQSFQSISAI